MDIEEAKQILADPDSAALVSVRAWNEHIGKISGYNYIGPAGRIAGDVWGNCGSDAYHMQHYRNLDNTMRPVPGDRDQLGRGRDHARQVGRVLLRDRLAGERDLVLRLPDGLAAHRRLRRGLVGVEPGSRSTTRSRSASPPRRRPDRLRTRRASLLRPARPPGRENSRTSGGAMKRAASTGRLRFVRPAAQNLRPRLAGIRISPDAPSLAVRVVGALALVLVVSVGPGAA